MEWRLFRAYRLGLTYEGIANRLGFADRDAVNGKIRRLRARDPVRWAVRACDGRWREKRPGLLTAPKRITHVVVADGAPGVAGVLSWQQEDSMGLWKVDIPDHALLKLGEFACRWPVGVPGEEDFRYCGNKTDRGCSYCDFHKRMSTQRYSARELAQMVAS